MKLTVLLLALSMSAALALPQYKRRSPPLGLAVLTLKEKDRSILRRDMRHVDEKTKTTCDEAITDFANANGLNNNEKQEIVDYCKCLGKEAGSFLAQAEGGENTSDDNGSKGDNCIEILKKYRKEINLNK